MVPSGSMVFGEEKLTLCLVEIELRSLGRSGLGLVHVPNEFSLLSCYSGVWTWLYMQLYIHLASSVHDKSRFNSETKACASYGFNFYTASGVQFA